MNLLPTAGSIASLTTLKKRNYLITIAKQEANSKRQSKA
jgi:hypothetical protein